MSRLYHLNRILITEMIAAAIFVFVFSFSVNGQVTSDSIQGMLYLTEASNWAKQGQYSKGISAYEQCLPYFKNGKIWYFYFKAKIGIAYNYFDNNKYFEAKTAINRTIEEFQNIPPEEVPFSKLGDAWLCKGNIHNSLFEIEQAISAFENAIANYQKLPKSDEMHDKGTTYAYNNLGSANLKARNFAKATEYLTYALDYKKKVFGHDHQRTLNSMYLLSETWSQMGFLNKALEMLNQILAIEKKAKESDGIAHCYREISKVYQHKKDFKTAEEYIRRAIDFYKKSPSRTIYKSAICEHQMGNVLKDGGRYLESIPWFEKAIEKHNKIHKGNNYDSGLSTMNIGKAYTFNLEYKKGLQYYKKAWKIFDEVIANDNPRYIELWTSMGVCYREMGDHENARKLFSKSYNLSRKVLPKKTYDRSQSCYHLATVTINKKDALSLCQEGLDEISYSFSHSNLFDNPEVESIFHEQAGLQLFQLKINLLADIYQEEREEKHLTEALKTTEAASQLIDLIRQSFFTESAKRFLAKDAREIYETGIQVLYQLIEINPDEKYLDKAFNLMESSRGLILLEELHKEAAHDIVKIPDSIAFKLELLQNNILLFESQFSSTKKDVIKSQELNKKLFSEKEKLHKLEQDIALKYPEISNLKNNLNKLSITDVEQKIYQDEIVLEYLFTENNIYILKISKSDKKLYKRIANKHFQTELIEFIETLKNQYLALNAGNDKETYNSFCIKNNELSEKLIRNLSLTENQKLIVIPDLWLSYLPFEILLTNDSFHTDKVDYAALPLLIKTHPIRYSFSANLQFNNPDIHKKHNNKILAYAPEYEGSTNEELITRGGFSALENTIKEVREIEGIIPGTIITGQDAIEQNFKNKAEDYGILHLAMHAFTDEENPMVSGLIFSESENSDDDVLRAYELQSMSLNAQLAVLSACNTGSGKLEKGEGIMSLGRGFRRAGVPNIVMSLWQVDDEATRFIISDFYRHLKSGQTPDLALRQAKLDYLKIGRKTHPFFWSPFIYMGDKATLSFINSNNYFFYSILGLLVLMLAWFGYKKFQ